LFLASLETLVSPEYVQRFYTSARKLDNVIAVVVEVGEGGILAWHPFAPPAILVTYSLDY